MLRQISRFFSGIGGFLKFWILFADLLKLTAHHCELSVVDAKRDYADGSKNAVNDKLRSFNPSKLSRKFFFRILLTCAGAIPVTVCPFLQPASLVLIAPVLPSEPQSLWSELGPHGGQQRIAAHSAVALQKRKRSAPPLLLI